MNRTQQILSILCLLAVTLNVQAGDMHQSMKNAEKQSADQDFGQVLKASQLIDTGVRNYENERLGRVEDIVLNRESDRVAYLVVGSGGFMGIGRKYTAVPLQAIRPLRSGDGLVLNLSTEAFKNAPELGSSWPTPSEQELQQMNEFFSEQTVGTSGWIPGSYGMEPIPMVDPMTPEQAAAERQRMARCANHLIGMNVWNNQDTSIGKLADIMIDMKSGEVALGLINIQGVEGLQQQAAACPWRMATILPQDQTVRVNINNSTLRSVAFSRDSVPNLSDRSYARRVYEQFNQEPYWTTYGYEGEDMQRHKSPQSGTWKHQQMH